VATAVAVAARSTLYLRNFLWSFSSSSLHTATQQTSEPASNSASE